MANNLKQKEFNEMKNELFTIVIFNNETKERVLTYGNLNYKKVIEEIIKYQSYNNICIIINQKKVPKEFDLMTSYNFNDYIPYMINQIKEV